MQNFDAIAIMADFGFIVILAVLRRKVRSKNLLG